MPSPLPSVPTCIYAIGDIHGRADLLSQLVEKITADAASLEEAKHIVFLGDYIDRGPESRTVLDFLIQEIPSGLTPIFLRGNHEDILLRFLAGDESVCKDWLHYGGRETLASYGLSAQNFEEMDTEKRRATLWAHIPQAHLDFLAATQFSYTSGDYFFAHAGIRPGVPLSQQTTRDLLWARHIFIPETRNYEKIIVHGHTISIEPDIQFNRIGIDTGAYASGRLTCLKLHKNTRAFLST